MSKTTILFKSAPPLPSHLRSGTSSHPRVHAGSWGGGSHDAPPHKLSVPPQDHHPSCGLFSNMCLSLVHSELSIPPPSLWANHYLPGFCNSSTFSPSDCNAHFLVQPSLLIVGVWRRGKRGIQVLAPICL